MDSFETDLETLENAMRRFFQTMKRPQNWALVASRSGVTIDRPSAVILKLLIENRVPCHVQNLADHLGIEAPFVTRKTQELERADYLRRVTDRTDRRAVELMVTPRGRAVSKKLWKAQRDIIAEALADWGQTDRRQFVRLFEQFSDDLATASTPSIRSKEERAPNV